MKIIDKKRLVSNNSSEKTVVLAGCGIVNLITAYYLIKNGYSVEIFDRSPDPRTRPSAQLLGCSAGGGDSRVFSINEARHHFLNSRHYEGEVSSPFKRTIADGGNLVISPAMLSQRDFNWNERFEAVTRESAVRFNEDIISFNRESEPLWREMIASHPELFQRSGFKAGLFRIYATSEKFDRARASEAAMGSLKRILSVDEIAKELPVLRGAVDAGGIAGGLEVTGFSVNIHSLIDHLISYLFSQGVEFQWQVEINSIERDSSGLVTKLKAGSQSIEACHYVMSLGAASQELLSDFLCADAVAPVIGCWLTIPNMTPHLDFPLKVSRAGFASNGAAEGANVVPGLDRHGRPVIHISSGHGYLGFGNESGLHGDVIGLGQAVKETARDMFPKIRWTPNALNAMDGDDRKTCVRPWTATGLGIFEQTGTNREGSFIITGGHNTGGFSQSPAVAMAVIAALEHHSHPMHSLYHPQRMEMETARGS